MTKYFLYIITLLIFVSCLPGSTKTTIDEDIVALKNTSWELIRPKNLSATLTFNENATKISGFNGCNDYTAEIKKKNYQFEIGIFTTTERFCEETSDQEDEYMKTLAQVSDYLLTNDKLQLKLRGATLLTFKEIKE